MLPAGLRAPAPPSRAPRRRQRGSANPVTAQSGSRKPTPPAAALRATPTATGLDAVTALSSTETPRAPPLEQSRAPPRRPARLRPPWPDFEAAPDASFELRSGAARLQVGTDGSLLLFRGDATTPSARARAVVPFFIARHGAAATVSAAGGGGRQLEMRWGDAAVLRVSAVEREGSQALAWEQARRSLLIWAPSSHTRPAQGLDDAFRVEFAIRPRPGAAHPRDMAELVVELATAGSWYGGGHLMRQHWPLERGAWEVGPHYPFDNGPNGVNTLLASHWVTSKGALVLADPDTPYLHVGLNSPPPRRNWFFGGIQKISFGVGIQNFTRQILPLPAAERRGDGLLRLQARSSYESRRIAHPLSGWAAPAEAPLTAALAAAAALQEGEGDGVVASLLHGLAHARDAAVAAGQAAAEAHSAHHSPSGPAAPPRAPREQWLTLRTVLAAKADVKAATQAVHASLPKPPHGPLPLLLRAPIWTTWARYKAGVTQAAVERFAGEIAGRSLPRSVLEIDDRWQSAYGDLAFDAAKFPDPSAMVAGLHAQGFAVTLWVMPFCEEASPAYAEGAAQGFFVRSSVSAGLGLKPGFFRWWNSAPAAALDVTNPAAVEWFVGRLHALQAAHGIDGFKFDAGEPCFLPPAFETHAPLAHPSEYTALWVSRVAARFACAEVRTGHRTQGVPLLTRMGDRFSEWGVDNGLGSLIPTLLTSGVLGYPFCLPDMIGGNAYFGRAPNPELMARWAQANALMPAVQFSIAPWDLSAPTEALVAASLEARAPELDTICALAEAAAADLAPICRPLWWLAPTDAATFAIDDQFALGDDLIVAPVVQRGATMRDVYLTAGLWRDVAGVQHEGGRWLRDYPAPLEALPRFWRIS